MASPAAASRERRNDPPTDPKPPALDPKATRAGVEALRLPSALSRRVDAGRAVLAKTGDAALRRPEIDALPVAAPAAGWMTLSTVDGVAAGLPKAGAELRTPLWPGDTEGPRLRAPLLAKRNPAAGVALSAAAEALQAPPAASSAALRRLIM